MIELTIGAVIGAGIVFTAMYPQLTLLRSMLIDKHAKETLKTVAPSQVAELAQTTAETPFSPNAPTTRHDLTPPLSLEARRKLVEDQEAEVMRRRQADVRMVSDL